MKLWPFGKKQTTRTDGYMNANTGMGIQGVDKTQGSIFVAPVPLEPVQSSDLYSGNDIAALIVDVPVDEALRQGVKVRTEDSDETKCLSDWLTSNHVLSKLADAARWGRLYGNSALLLGTDDTVDRKEPLDLSKVKALNYLAVLDREEIAPESFNPDGSVRAWFVTPLETGITSVVHSSRLVVFDGVKTPKRKKRDNSGYCYSVLDRVNEVIEQFCATYSNAGVLLADGNQAIFKVADLKAMIGSDPEIVQKRFNFMNLARSVHRAIVIDAGDGMQPPEEFTRNAAQFSGLADMMRMFVLRLSGAVRIPATILMGQSPAGMNATGESDLRWFYNRLEGYQKNDLEPALRRVIEVLRASKAWPYSDDGDIFFSWPELWGASESEKATARKTQAEADNIYWQMGALLADEIACQRFATDDFNSTTVLSAEALAVRKQSLQEEYEQFGQDIQRPGQGADAPGSQATQGDEMEADTPTTPDI